MKRRRILLASAATAVLVAGVGVWALGPGGPFLVAHLAEGRSVWRLGKLHVEGVSGAALADLRIARATLTDDAGVWLEARDLSLRWSPLAVLGGKVAVHRAGARHFRVFRQPHLTPPRPPGREFDVTLDELKIARIDVDNAVLGNPAVFTLRGDIAARGADVRRAHLDLHRLDAADDALTLALSRGDALHFDAAMHSPAGGFFATALGARADVRVSAKADGADAAGGGALDANVGAASLATGAFAWTPNSWRGESDIDLTTAPALARLAAALGPRAHLEGHGGRSADSDFTATLVATHAGAEIRGKLRRNGAPEGPLNVTARADRLETFAPGVSAGGATFTGTLTLEQGAARFDGQLAGHRVRTGAVVSSFAGPAQLRWTRTQVEAHAEAALQSVEAIPAVTRLARSGRLTVDAVYDTSKRNLRVQRAQLQSPNADIAAAGVLGRGGDGLRGSWRIRQLSEADRRIGGAAEGTWSITTERVLTLQGAARQFSTTMTPLDQLLGAAPRLDALFAIRDGAIDVRRFVVSAPKLRLGAVGALRGGDAALALEASATGPLTIGAAEIAGIVDATGKLTGRLDDPSLTGVARMREIDIAGRRIERPEVTLTLAPQRNGARMGHADLVGALAGARATASADVRSTEASLAFDNLRIEAAGVSARGTAALTETGPVADISFEGPAEALAAPLRGAMTGRATLTPVRGGEPTLQLDASLVRGSLGALSLRQTSIRASGPLDRLTFNGRVRGAAASGAPVNLDMDGALVRTGAVATLQLQARGAIADANVSTSAPMEIRFTEGAVSGRGAVALGDGALTFDLTDAGARLSLAAKLDNAPVAPLAALAGEPASGRMSGTLTAAGDARGLNGALDLTFADALFARRARDPVTLRIKGKLNDGALTLQADAASRNGLDAAFDATAPVTARARPLRIALAGEGRATWRAKGPADALWGIVGSLDQQVAGDVDGHGAFRFAAGRLAGDGALTLSNGRFADKQTGIDLREVSARLAFDQQAARLEQFSARDARNGTITGTGRVDGLQNGRIDLVARNIQLLGRPDARATASGPLAFVWTPAGAKLTGDLAISEATLAPPRAAANIPLLDVFEINRPETASAPPVRRRSALNATVDIRVRAPGRVFLRGRGLDSEWSLDLSVRGPADNTGVYGVARLVRGRFTLAGRPFEADSGQIRFNGAPDEALIDLAAALNAPDLVARVTLTGPVSDPDVAFSSTPALPEDEVLPQALFGRAAADLSPLEAAQLAASLAELAGQASLNIAGAARDLVGLDRLDVRDTGTGLRIAGGKYLTRNVYLEVARTGIGEAETQVEWRVRPQLFLISAFQPNGDRRLSVRWRREY